MKNKQKLAENIIHGVFLVMGLITVGCVLLISIYLIISGIPAIAEIGLFDFLFGKEWASTAETPSYGILPFILTSIYGTAGAILVGVPVGFFTAVFLAKFAPKKVKTVIESAVSLLAGIRFGCLRICGNVGARSRNQKAFRYSRRCKPICGNYRACRNDFTINYQGFAHSA